MEPVRKIVHPKTSGPVDLSLILNAAVSMKIKVRLIRQIYENTEECCRTKTYFDNMIFVLIKLLNSTEPVFSPDNDLFELRIVILQIIIKVLPKQEQLKIHFHNILKSCIQVVETDNEQTVLCSVSILKDLIGSFKPKYDGVLKAEIYKLLMLIKDIYNNSSSLDKIFNFQKTSDLKVLITTIRVTTTVTRNSVNYVFVPMGKVSFKVLKELALLLKTYYIFYNEDPDFKKNILEMIPVLVSFFNLDIPYKPDHKDLVIDLKHAQVRLLFFFSQFVKGIKDGVRIYCPSLPGRIISLMNCNVASDITNIRSELLSGFESVVLNDFKHEFLPYMDKFLDETLITGRSWSSKSSLRPKAYIYIDHLITHLHSQLSLNFLVRVVHLHFSNLLDPTLQPEFQINLCNMVMNVLSYIVQRQNQSITNLNLIEKDKSPLIDLFYRVFNIFVLKLKQFRKFYLPQITEFSISKENVIENITSILTEKQSNENMDFKYGYHPSQIAPYSLADSKRFLKIIFPAIRTVFQFIVKIEGEKFLIHRHYKKTFNHFLNNSLLSLKIFECPLQKKEMVKEILNALSCISPNHLMTLITGDHLVKQIYANHLETLIFEITLKDEVLVSIFSSLIFDYILNNLFDENEKSRISDLIDLIQLNVKLNHSDDKHDEYIYKIIQELKNNLQNTEHPMFCIGILKTMLIIVETASYEFGETMYSVIRCLLDDLLSYHKSLTSDSVETKVAIAELCLAECVFKVVLHSHIMDLLSVIAYSLQIPELTLQGLGILEKCLDILPVQFLDDPVLPVRNEIMKGLCDCVRSPYELISLSAVGLLGKFGGLNRSSVMNTDPLKSQEQFHQVSKKPKICLTFDDYNNTSLEMDVAPGVHTAVQALILDDDEFNRLQSWNVISGYLVISMEYDSNRISQLLSNIKLETLINKFADDELQYTNTIIDETYIKALTGLMICCADECLKEDALKLFNEFIKRILHISIIYFSDISYGYALKVNPYVITDAICAVLSNEKESVFHFGVTAIEFILRESHNILGDNVVYFPFITHMFRQFCDLCYDLSWIRKRGGCLGLQTLFSNLLKEDTEANDYSNWFIKHFDNTFRATLFIFLDYNRHLTFGTLKIAESNLENMLNWLYWIKPINPSHDLIQDTILLEITDYITGPNDLLREQSIKIINLMANKQQKSVSDTLEPYYKHIQQAIPGNRLFDTYTFKSQIGIMKGHIFCALNSIPTEQLDFINKINIFYFNMINIICKGDSKEINSIKMFKCLTSTQLFEFRRTAMEVLVHSSTFMANSDNILIFEIFLNALMSSDLKMQEIVYQCLESRSINLIIELKMVDELLLYYNDLFQDPVKVTLINISYIFYVTKLFPSCPNKMFCTTLLNSFKYLWNNQDHCIHKTSIHELELSLQKILQIVSQITETQFFHVKEICELILNQNTLNVELCNRLYPYLTECLLKFPVDCIQLFFLEQNIKNSTWTLFFNSMIRNNKCGSLRNVLTSDCIHLETLLSASRIDPSRTIQYESIQIIYNLAQMEKKWIFSSKKIISILLNIWTGPQYKERYKNLAAIKSTEWKEPKMLIKIILAFYRDFNDEVFILFQTLSVFSNRFPIDINFFRKFIENEIIQSGTIQWKRMVFFKFIELYQKKTMNTDILGKILQYIILPCFSMCYKKGEKQQLLYASKPEENIIGIVLNKIFHNIRAVLNGCDFDGIKVFLCQLICLLVDDLVCYNDSVCELIYNSIAACTTSKCSMDINVKYHCYLLLTYLIISKESLKKDKVLEKGIHQELLKASFTEALPVINYSLSLIVSDICVKNDSNVQGLVSCIKKILSNESQNVPTLHHVCLFIIKYNTLFSPFKEFLINTIIKALFPIAKTNNIPDFKNTAIELACLIISWELTDTPSDLTLKLPLKRSIDDAQSKVENSNTLPQKKKSSQCIENCLNFLAMVGCQTHDDKPESLISKLAIRSRKLFKNILTTEPIDTMKLQLKYGWFEKLCDSFLKKEQLFKQNPRSIHGNSTASLMNLLAAFETISLLLSVLPQDTIIEAIKPVEDHLIKFIQFAFIEGSTLSSPYNHREVLVTNRHLSIQQVKQVNEGTLNFIADILKTFSSNEGLQKLHLYIPTIISEGLNSNCSNKLEISLTLLKFSLIHFPNYMNNEILNTMGDIMFKFNENNGNPKVKVLCLEILKTHVDSLPRLGKQIFIEKVVIENLDRARDFENNIPFEVQLKCFELVLTYMKDLSEAAEGVFLNSTLLEYIKTTTDERIMIIILNIITKWIEICRDEAVLFNCQIIKILKSITFINRFPKFYSYCYKLNLEIFRNWNFSECIEYGISCKTASIRHDFLNFYDTLWKNGGLCMRLYTLMSNELSYNVDTSIAFYVQLLMIKISKNTKIQGDFPLLVIKNSVISDETDATRSSSSISYQVKNISTFDMCFSLAQLSFIDEDLAKYLWISLLPGVWSLFSDDQRNLLSARAINFLAKSKMRNNFMTAFYEAIILCKPTIDFKPYQMVYIGKTFNLWYLVIDQMEDICSYYVHDKKDEAVEGMIQMYSLLREEDVLESLFQNTIKCETTKKAFSLEQQGYINEASQVYMKLLDQEKKETKICQTNSYNKDSMFRKIRLTKCLRELNKWSYLTEHILEDDNFLLNIEYRWKTAIEKSTCDDLRWYLENKQKFWPTKLMWKYHFYLGMLGLKELDQQVMFTVQEHIDLASTEIINEWKLLPMYLCNAHIPLLQASQLIVEVREALNIQNSLFHSPEDINNIDTLIQIWHNRNPWIGDSLKVWSDLILWRQTYYSFLNQHNLNLKTDFIKSAEDKSKLHFGEIALKHNMTDVSIDILNSINPSNITISNWLHKMNLEVKCKQSKVIKYNKKFNDLANLPLRKDFMDDMKPLLLTIIGSFQDFCGNTDIASKYYNMFCSTKESKKCTDVEWKCIIEDNFKLIPLHLHKCSNRQAQLNTFVITLNCNELLENAWFQWATLIEHNFNQLSIKDLNIALLAIKCYIIASTFTTNIKCNIVVARILWLLTYDDDKYTLLRTFENCNLIFSDIWLPQMLNIFVEKNIKAIVKIIAKIGQWYPQKMYLTLNRMYLTEKMKNAMDTMSANTLTSNDVRKKTFEMLKIDKIKKMMTLIQKCNLGIIQLDYFVDQITSLGESWDEELRRKLYECLYLSYDFAFKTKNLNVSVPREISNFIKTIIISFVAEDVNTIQLQMKKTFFVPDYLSEYYLYFKQKFSSDFSSSSVSTINLMIIQLKKWIKYIEDKSNYPARFVHHFRCPTIHQFDWSVIRIPSDYYIDDSSGAVRIHNFSGHVHLIDKNGTVVKQLSIRGTDGRIYTYNVSRGQAIESEDRIFQLFRVANSYLLDFKETAKRHLMFSIPNTFSIAPNLRMVETKKNSIFSLFEIYTEMNKRTNKTKVSWIHEDIDFWFSVLNTCIITEKTQPLMECLLAVSNKYGSDEVLKNWVSSIYPLQSDYWTFRKTFVENYSLLCFFEYAFNLIKLKPEMLNIDKNNGVAVALFYTFNLSEVHGNLVQNHIIPFRLTPNLTKFITPYRKYQMINCITVTGNCLTNNIDDFSVVLKLLLKDEFMAYYNIKTCKKISRNEIKIFEVVDENLKYILKNFNKLKNSSIQNPVPELIYQAFHKDILCYESPIWRAWL